MTADEDIDNLEEEKVVTIEEIAEVLERRPKDKLRALRYTKEEVIKGNC